MKCIGDSDDSDDDSVQWCATKLLMLVAMMTVTMIACLD
jgi:hypothetical protein